MSTPLLARIDPDAIHPARLSGPHAWARWNLGRNPGPWGDVTLLVPIRDAGSVDAVASTIDEQLRRATWPPTAPIGVTRSGTTLRVDDGTRRASIVVTTRPWYVTQEQPSGSAMVVDANGWPVIDEAAALRERLEAVARDGVRDLDVEDIAGWVTRRAQDGRKLPSALRPLDVLLHRLRRDAPQVYDTLVDVEARAIQSLCSSSPARHLADPFRFLTESRHLEEHRRARSRQ